MKSLGIGKKHTTSGSSLENGLTAQEAFDAVKPLRGETATSQRPTATDKTVKDERGSFTSKC